jgi:hypothetical protein
MTSVWPLEEEPQAWLPVAAQAPAPALVPVPVPALVPVAARAPVPARYLPTGPSKLPQLLGLERVKQHGLGLVRCLHPGELRVPRRVLALALAPEMRRGLCFDHVHSQVLPVDLAARELPRASALGPAPRRCRQKTNQKSNQTTRTRRMGLELAPQPALEPATANQRALSLVTRLHS